MQFHKCYVLLKIKTMDKVQKSIGSKRSTPKSGPLTLSLHASVVSWSFFITRMIFDKDYTV